jgi:hypothetical protein
VSNLRFEDLVRDTEAMLKKGDAYASAANTSVLVSGQKLRDRARMFFSQLPLAGRMGGSHSIIAKSFWRRGAICI